MNASFYAVLLLTFAALVALHVGSMFAMARTFGIRVAKVTLGFGPTIAKFQRGETTWSLGVLPLGGSVQFHQEGGESSDEPNAYQQASRIARVAVAVSGCLALLLVACLLLGPGRAFQSALRLPSQLLHSLLTGEYFGSSLARLKTIFETVPLATMVGILAAKMGAFNLVPLPSLNGWSILTEPFRAPGAIPSKGHNVVHVIVMVLLLALVARSACVDAAHLRGSH